MRDYEFAESNERKRKDGVCPKTANKNVDMP